MMTMWSKDDDDYNNDDYNDDDNDDDNNDADNHNDDIDDYNDDDKSQISTTKKKIQQFKIKSHVYTCCWF